MKDSKRKKYKMLRIINYSQERDLTSKQGIVMALTHGHQEELHKLYEYIKAHKTNRSSNMRHFMIANTKVYIWRYDSIEDIILYIKNYRNKDSIFWVDGEQFTLKSFMKKHFPDWRV